MRTFGVLLNVFGFYVMDKREVSLRTERPGYILGVTEEDQSDKIGRASCRERVCLYV